MTVSYDSMALAQLNYSGLPVSDNNVKSMVVWAVSENALGNGAAWNIWDTEEGGEPGEGDFNRAGVKNYPDIQEGMDAFNRTLRNGDYEAIIQALSRSAPPAETANLIYNSSWGSKPTPDMVAEVLGNWDHYANLPVGGSAPVEEPPAPPVAEPPIEVPTAPTESEPDVQVPTLQVGSTGGPVKAVQAILNAEAGAGLVVDGNFGPATEGAVKAWQAFWHITEDGVVGPITWSTLVAL